MKLPFEELIPENSQAFIAKVIMIASQLGIKPAWLMLTMRIETAGTFKASIQNPLTKATGLIQFMPSTAIGLDTTVQDLAKMSNVQQLDYVYKYLKMYASKMKSYEDVYLAVFYPAAVGKADDYVFGTTLEMRKAIAVQNACYDVDKDLDVTKWEVKAAIKKFIPKGFEADFA